jgi:DNA repair exonuclease SbcCD ATPase subunit
MRKAHVPCEDAAKAIQAAAQMTASGLFSKMQITEWEEKVPTDKTWDNLKSYYAKLYKSKMQYSKGGARRTGHESVNAMRAKEKKWNKKWNHSWMHSNKKLTHNNEEINEIKEDQKVFVKLGKQLMQQMKQQQEIIDKLSKRFKDKENAPPIVPKTQGRQKHVCPNCKQNVFHKPANCPVINEEKHWPGWSTCL